MRIGYHYFKEEAGLSDYGNTLPCSSKLSVSWQTDFPFDFIGRINKRQR